MIQCRVWISNTRFVASIIAFSCLVTLNCKEANIERIKIIATTTLIGNIVERLGKDKVDLVTIIPGGMCPGHFDLKPGDIASLYDAKLVLNHGWEEWMKKLINVVENEQLVIKEIPIEENWMIPGIQKRAADDIAKILGEIDPSNKHWYEKNLYTYKKAIDSIATHLKEITKPLQDLKVVSSNYQADFLGWLGLDTIATYGRPEELTAKRLTEIIELGKKESVRLVIDNLQSGPAAGSQIAEEIGATHVVLTNFPVTNSYFDTLKENVDKILEAVR